MREIVPIKYSTTPWFVQKRSRVARQTALPRSYAEALSEQNWTVTMKVMDNVFDERVRRKGQFRSETIGGSFNANGKAIPRLLRGLPSLGVPCQA